MFMGVFSHGVLPRPPGPPDCVPAKYAVEVRITSFMLIPIALTERWMICASCGISPVISVVRVIEKPCG